MAEFIIQPDAGHSRPSPLKLEISTAHLPNSNSTHADKGLQYYLQAKNGTRNP